MNLTDFMTRTARPAITGPVMARPIRSGELRAATVAVAAGGVFALLLAALHVLEPEYDPTWRFVSEYALGRVGWLMPLAFAALAVSLAATTICVARHARGILGRLGIGLIGVAAAGLLLAAFFRTDPITTPVELYTVSGQLHVLGAALDYSPLGMLLVALAVTRPPEWRRHRRRLLLSTALPLAATIAIVLALPADGRFGPGVLAGLFGRVLLVSYLGWALALRTTLLRRASTSATSTRTTPPPPRRDEAATG